MTTVMLVLFVFLEVLAFSAWVLAVWIFPRLFLAQYSPQIWESIRRHPVIHIIWALIGLAAICLLFRLSSGVVTCRFKTPTDVYLAS